MRLFRREFGEAFGMEQSNSDQAPRSDPKSPLFMPKNFLNEPEVPLRLSSGLPQIPPFHRGRSGAKHKTVNLDRFFPDICAIV
jgi:hypothetical protein